MRGDSAAADVLGGAGGFNPRPSVRGDRGSLLSEQLDDQFQSTPLCEGRPTGATKLKVLAKFQSTPLCEGRLGAKSINALSSACFNPRPSVRGDFFPLIIIILDYMFQSTPLCEGRRVCALL